MEGLSSIGVCTPALKKVDGYYTKGARSKIMRMLGVIVSIVGLIIIPVALYVLTQHGPDLRYTLSDPIRIGQAEGGKIWQQVEVKNRGEVEAKDIQVKVNAEICDHEIVKNSEGDEVQVFSLPNVFELRYSALPPKGNFILTLATSESRVRLENIVVSHNKGLGVEAFSGEGRLGRWVPLAFVIVVFFVYMGLGARATLVSVLEGQARYERPEKVLKRGKPFYLGTQKWGSLRKEALRNTLSERLYGFEDVSLSKAYVTLCGSRPSYLTEDEWNQLRGVAVSQVQESMSKKLYLTPGAEGVLPLVRLARPKNMPESIWSELQEKAMERYFEKKVRQISWTSLRKLPGLLSEEMPQGLSPGRWQEYTAEVEKRYLSEIESGLRFAEDPVGFVEEQELSLLSPGNVAYVRDLAYRCALRSLADVRRIKHARQFLGRGKPKWLKEEDYTAYKESAQKTVELDARAEEWKKKVAALEKERREVSAKGAELSEKIAKVSSQLEIINEVLCDATALDRIEDYNNAFAAGNFANLRKVAVLISKSTEEA